MPTTASLVSSGHRKAKAGTTTKAQQSSRTPQAPLRLPPLCASGMAHHEPALLGEGALEVPSTVALRVASAVATVRPAPRTCACACLKPAAAELCGTR